MASVILKGVMFRNRERSHVFSAPVWYLRDMRRPGWTCGSGGTHRPSPLLSARVVESHAAWTAVRVSPRRGSVAEEGHRKKYVPPYKRFKVGAIDRSVDAAVHLKLEIRVGSSDAEFVGFVEDELAHRNEHRLVGRVVETPLSGRQPGARIGSRAVTLTGWISG